MPSDHCILRTRQEKLWSEQVNYGTKLVKLGQSEIFTLGRWKSWGSYFWSLPNRRQGSRPSPRNRNAKKQNGWLRRPYKTVKRKAKRKGEKERYTHLNAEFQKARRGKKAFLNDQCKDIEENNRMGRTGDLFKKIRDTNGTFHAQMCLIKDRNDMDLTEAGDIKKRWQ